MNRAAEQGARQEIIRFGRAMYERGYISASEGNLSARLGPGRILVTCSGVHKGFLTADQLMLVDDEGRPLGAGATGSRRLAPTSELPMHLEAYRRRPEIGAVIHAHPPHAISLSIAGLSLADCLLPEAIVLLGLIPTTAYATPSSEENAAAIRALIGRHDALVLQRHGALTVGTDLMEAFIRLEVVEQSARIAFMLAQLGVRNPLEPAEVRKLLHLREQMGLARPGEAEAFCEACGVCHPAGEHTPLARPALGPPSASPDPAAVRALVADLVHKALGEA
ncbi:MAG: class II aldolase/adducin family protein [Candidatus Promineifilaceae bacterium]